MNNLINVIGGSDGPTSVFIAGKTATISLIVMAVIALLISFLGLKLIRLWNVIWGLSIGAAIGFAVSGFVRLDTTVVLITTAAAALVMAVLSGIFVKFGAFWVCFFSVFAMMITILNPHNWIMIAVCGGVSLIVAIAAMIWFEPLVIVVTAVFGGFQVGRMIAALAGFESVIITVVISGIVAALGIVVQFAMKSSEINKKEVKRAKAIKEEMSKEAEIEQARNILDLDDEDDDEE